MSIFLPVSSSGSFTPPCSASCNLRARSTLYTPSEGLSVYCPGYSTVTSSPYKALKNVSIDRLLPLDSYTSLALL